MMASDTVEFSADEPSEPSPSSTDEPSEPSPSSTEEGAAIPAGPGYTLGLAGPRLKG
jgi:hypothetical protein